MQVPHIDGYDTQVVKATDELLIFRINVFDKEGFFAWKDKFCEANNTTLNVKRTTSDTAKYKFYQLLKCQHGGRFRSHHSKHRKVDTK